MPPASPFWLTTLPANKEAQYQSALGQLRYGASLLAVSAPLIS
jgi:hypothetical protein